jgi:hypothetical protein
VFRRETQLTDASSAGQDREDEHRRRFEESMKDTIKTAKAYYETNRKINIIIVIVGIIFLANSIAYTWIKGVDYFSIFSGGLSIASFATLFFTKPQENITRALGNLAQIQMIYKAYCLQFDALLDFHLRQENANLDTICSINSAVGNVANNAAALVQKNVEVEEANITRLESEKNLSGAVNTKATTLKTSATALDNK